MERILPMPSRFEWTMVALAVVGLPITVAAEISAHVRLGDMTMRVARAENERLQRTASIAASAPAISAKQTQELNAAIQRLNVPTISLLSSLAAPKASGVTLVSLDFKPEGSPGGGQVSIVAEAANADSMLEYLDLLAVRKPLRDVELVKHERIAGSTGMTLRFEAQAKWKDKA